MDGKVPQRRPRRERPLVVSIVFGVVLITAVVGVSRMSAQWDKDEPGQRRTAPPIDEAGR